jgi:hypothetical protein
MSSVRMCDTCGTIFSELEEGWASGTVAIRTRDRDGKMTVKNADRDQCASCVVLLMDRPHMVAQPSIPAPEPYTVTKAPPEPERGKMYGHGSMEFDKSPFARGIYPGDPKNGGLK